LGTLGPLLTLRVAGAHRAASGEDHLGVLDGEAAPLLDREDEPAQVDVDVVQAPAFRAAEVGVALGPRIHPEGPVAHLHETDLVHRLQVVQRLVHGPQRHGRHGREDGLVNGLDRRMTRLLRQQRVDQVALRGHAEAPGAEVGRQRVGVAHDSSVRRWAHIRERRSRQRRGRRGMGSDTHGEVRQRPGAADRRISITQPGGRHLIQIGERVLGRSLTLPRIYRRASGRPGCVCLYDHPSSGNGIGIARNQ
jgi:hypothetical protein